MQDVQTRQVRRARRPPTTWRRRVVDFLPHVLVAAPFVVLAIQLLATRPGISVYGDDALIDLAVLDALAGDQTAGVYSRLGFRHPGPSYFYLVAPVAAITGTSRWSLYLGLQLIHLTAAVGIVEVARRRFGPGPSAAASVIVLAYTLALGFTVLRSPWNPLVILLPLALYLVLIGSDSSFGIQTCLALMVGTFVVQTNLGAAPVVVATAVAVLAWHAARAVWARRTAGEDPGRQPLATWDRRTVVGATAVLLVTSVAWAPPAIDVLRNGAESNLVSILDSMSSGADDYGAAPSTSAAARVVGRELATVGAGVPYGSESHKILDPASLGVGPLLSLAGACVIAALVAWIGWRARSASLAGLGAVGGLAVIASVVAVSRAIGGLHWHVTVWVSALAVPLLVAAAAALWANWSPGRLGLLAALVVAAAMSIVTTAAVTRAPGWAEMSFPPAESVELEWGRTVVGQAWDAAEPAVRDMDTVHITGGEGIWWAVTAGLAARFEQDGITVTVDDAQLGKFGERRRSTGHEDARLLLATQGSSMASEEAELLATVGGVPIYLEPTRTGG